MKKLFFVLAIGAFAACNNSSSTEAKTDSAKVDSAAAAKVDTATKKLDSAAAKVDTAAKKLDSVKK